jgi:glucose-6-phosphate isomerase
VLTRTKAWQALQEHWRNISQRHMRDLFDEDPQRFERFSLKVGDVLCDYSRNRMVAKTMALLCALAREVGLEEKIGRMFAGERINVTEQRAALHVALRNRANRPMAVDGRDVMPRVNAVLDKMRRFCDQVRREQWRGYTGRPVRDVVNIGIGGSDLGPRMVVEALRPYGRKGPRVHFVANIDPADLALTLAELRPETTLFVIASKTFGTQETLANAHAARDWFLAAAGDEQHIARHFVAVSTHVDKVRAFGIDPDNMFEFWDWVGGRYSLWSAIGLSIALAIGMERFEDLLAGAHLVDEHFRTAPLERNLPVILGLLGLWYINVFGAQSHAVLPYARCLGRFPAYLQQADMESNGKRVTCAGAPVGCATAPVLWGEPGTNGQHAFFQLLHQGTRLVPADFLVPLFSHYAPDGHQEMLLANCLAQGEALMRGRTMDEARQAMVEDGLDQARIAALLPHRVFPGNRPSNTLLFDKLTPRVLGTLIALYEHKIFVQGALWDINSFDQWGVELGKQLAGTLLSDIRGQTPPTSHDASTAGLLRHIREGRRRG